MSPAHPHQAGCRRPLPSHTPLRSAQTASRSCPSAALYLPKSLHDASGPGRTSGASLRPEVRSLLLLRSFFMFPIRFFCGPLSRRVRCSWFRQRRRRPRPPTITDWACWLRDGAGAGGGSAGPCRRLITNVWRSACRCSSRCCAAGGRTMLIGWCVRRWRSRRLAQQRIR